MARYKAENVDRAARPANAAADLGTAVHAALEWYVKAVYIDKTKPASLQALLMLYRMQFMVIFDTVDPEAHDWYAEGADMLKVWFARTDFSNRRVISCEIKTNFEIPTSAGKIPFNYIWDRFDELLDRPNEYEVVDYKTIRKALSPDDLRKKIQARFYGLAAQIEYPNAEKIWVRFDLLRHDSVATVFTRDDNKATWAFAKKLTQKIIDTADSEIAETLNPECHFCVRAAACETLKSNILGGGVWSLTTTDARINARAQLEFQRKGLDAVMADLDELILEDIANADVTELSSDKYIAKAVQSFRRSVDAERVEHMVGQDLFNKYGGVSLTMAGFNKLLKDRSVDPDLKKQLEGLVYRKAGDLAIKIDSKNPIDED
jgi:RecB family exonuclease